MILEPGHIGSLIDLRVGVAQKGAGITDPVVLEIILDGVAGGDLENMAQPAFAYLLSACNIIEADVLGKVLADETGRLHHVIFLYAHS